MYHNTQLYEQMAKITSIHLYSPFKLMRITNILAKNNFADMHLLEAINKKVV